MTLETWFSLASMVAMAGWLMLAMAPGWRLGTHVLAGFVLPGVLAAMYLGLMVTGSGSGAEDGGFGTLAGVRALFADDQVLLVGWIHYLCFDLFIGAWEVRDARRRGIHHLMVLPCLVFTFMLGPVGWGAYALLRQVAGTPPPEA